MKKVKIGIIGYGNLAKGVELAVYNSLNNFELIGIFTRRNPNDINTNFKESKVYSFDSIKNFKDKIDIMIVCNGSATDLPIQGPKIAKYFSTIDSFDNHTKIYDYYTSMNKIAKENNNLSLISCGWDPGLFSINRCLLESILPNGDNYVFYGKGLSQGHSDAIRKIPGVKKAVQYTIPYEEAINKVRTGENPKFNSVKEMMWRECFIVLEDETIDKNKIENEIKNMPNYFKDYTTKVNFISEKEFNKNHTSMPHGGFVLRHGKTSENNNQIAEFSLKLDSNPEFTGSVLLTYAKAVYKMKQLGNTGAITVLDIPISMLSNKTNEELLKQIL